MVHFTDGALGKTLRLHSFDVFFNLTLLAALHLIALQPQFYQNVCLFDTFLVFVCIDLRLKSV